MKIIHRLLLQMVVSGLALGAGGVRADGDALEGVLQLSDGRSLDGKLCDSDQAGILCWHARGFERSFKFSSSAVASVSVLNSPSIPAAGDLMCEFAGGDVLIGTLRGLKDAQLQLEVPEIGEVQVQMAHLARITTQQGSGHIVYLGPNGLTGWFASDGAWREDGGQLVAQRKKAVLYANLGIPAKACVECEISWTQRPNFTLALGVGQIGVYARNGFCLETWGKELVLLRETADTASLALVQKIEAQPGRIHLKVYLDQEQGEAAVLSKELEPLAKIEMALNRPQVLPGLRLEDRAGCVRLERLRITRWDGEPPTPTKATGMRLARADRSIAYGDVVSYDPALKEFVFRADGKDARVRFADVEGITFPKSADVAVSPVSVVGRDGSRVSGQLVQVADGKIWMRSRAIQDVITIPVTRIQALVCRTDPDAKDEPPKLLGRLGRLEIGNTILSGVLVDGEASDKTSCIVWQPQGSWTASPLANDASGRIVYRDVTSRAARSPKVIRAQPARPGRIMPGITRMLGNRPAARPLAEPTIYLRSGDRFPAAITAIDETGVTFQSKVTDATFVRHEAMKAIRFGAGINAPLTAEKRERLLTVPRLQRDSPPTHLVQSIHGDYLRCRLLEMSGDTLKVEVRLEPKTIARNTINAITWFSEDTAEHERANKNDPGQLRVQAVCSDGLRFTFQPRRFLGSELIGNSEALGACHVATEQLDQLRFGESIDPSSDEPDSNWQLVAAVNPRFASAESADESNPQMDDSPLVGKPAPPFDLEMLGGGRFKLEEHRGSIVVLDFWATWCGPCMQSMPVVEKIVAEFADQGVRLVAVNLQEEPQAIDAKLERLQLRLPVALDRDGAVAEAYEARAIPQTVVIDREGHIANLFVGGGSSLAEQLRESLRKVLAEGN